ncbi:hypothetical protein KL948_004654 [Ogataea haglerorum]|uniref:YEATS domain-containing protein n=1 Tax=Ogataea haglerorum TaxID=1937702 RepID=A0ABQ7RAT6_9ASCO|nr:uncharacterized protein KL911_004924 [Ogataea haglerorum]KAG7692322.1 hypothetical protein KL915_004753 [Ogataea haglerorum]KAG7726672.1 hypothetical protein KL948_004654 [Ogataea haglerorum]KAG7736354.1 hypothetical protein KL923_004820 [Ogataea haglerorum]KAG7749931.1 hypothetical protein KL911_004924 [Ogataea haglerorum]KAG7762329.1 hypothetical protein KL946_004725 [Ogataea haglerorum]
MEYRSGAGEASHSTQIDTARVDASVGEVLSGKLLDVDGRTWGVGSMRTPADRRRRAADRWMADCGELLAAATSNDATQIKWTRRSARRPACGHVCSGDPPAASAIRPPRLLANRDPPHGFYLASQCEKNFVVAIAMVEVKRTVRVTTTQQILKDIPPVQEGFPMREWAIQISLVDDKGVEQPATLFEKVTYHLHPTFANPVRSFKKPPFRIEEQGWGGFDIPITLTLIEKGGEKKINHDLNFMKEKYVIDTPITINTNKPALLSELAKTGYVPSANEASATPGAATPGATPAPAQAAGAAAAAKRKAGAVSDSKMTKKLKGAATKGGVDLEQLAEYLTKLSEDDLLGVVQMINDNKTPEMSVKNDVENGEFTMDLFTLPDTLLKSLWDYVKKRAE